MPRCGRVCARRRGRGAQRTPYAGVSSDPTSTRTPCA
jgi:hypothetical protein